MATEPKTTGLTYEELLEMFPDEDNIRRELIDGELIVTPSPLTRHQQVVGRLHVLLFRYAEEHGGEALVGPLDVFFSKKNVVDPDLLYLRAESLTKMEERFVRSAPDLVVEVSSPSTRKIDLGKKKELYERYGVPEYWFVDLEADRIEVYFLQEDRYASPTLVTRGQTLSSPLLPGLEVPVAQLLRPPAT